MVIGCTSGTSLPSLLSRSVATTRWLVTLLSLLSSLIPLSADVDGPCDSNAPNQCALPATLSRRRLFYVPLQFWYCRNPGLALPLIALQYHEVKINLDLRPIDECLWAVAGLDCSARSTSVMARSRSPTPTTSLLLLLRSTLTTSSLTPTSAAAWPRTPTST